MRKIFLTFMLFAVVGLLLGACTVGGGNLSIKEVWARPGLAGETSAVYFTIENGQSEADSLLSVSCDAAGMAELHISLEDDQGNMTMQPQEKVDVPAQAKVEFKPGGLHIMLMGLKEDLKVDQKLKVTLNFEKAGAVQIEATVREP
jgi:copper(I)-binding protein